MSNHRALLPLWLAALAGCHSFGPFAKQESELCCPTDVRKTVPWCAGEDAVFARPCGPDGMFYGHQATCWRTWPAPGAAWRDARCGMAGGETLIELPAPDAPLPTLPETAPPLTPEPVTGAPATLPETLAPPHTSDMVNPYGKPARLAAAVMPRRSPAGRNRVAAAESRRSRSGSASAIPATETAPAPEQLPVEFTASSVATEGTPANPFR